MYKRGFTLIEIIITISIIAILAVVGFVQYQTFQKNIRLTTESEKLIQILQLARDNTVSSVGGQQYGVHIEEAQYTLFTGDTYDALSNDNHVHTLSDEIEIYSTELAGGGDDVVFERISGETAHSGHIFIRIKNTSKERSIGVESSGQIGEETSTAPADTRITDSRHLHFDLGWSMQGASTLTLEFDDFPNPDVTHDIDMSSFFNGTQTDFFWSDTVLVDGENQILEINTHALYTTDTTLSVHRNAGENTKPLIILIDGKRIVTYASDDSATVGPFGGTMEQQ